MELKKLTNRRFTLAGISVVAVVLMQMALTACQQQIAQGPQSVPPNERQPAILPTPGPVASATPATGGKTVAYRVVQGNDGAHLEPIAMPSPAGSDPAVAILNSMAEMHDSPLPKGTKALSVKFDNDLATVDFNKAFAANFEGGDQREALMFNAITATLGQFPGVKRVQILVEGAKTAVGGTQDTTEPLDVPPTVTQVSQKTEDTGNHSGQP